MAEKIVYYKTDCRDRNKIIDSVQRLFSSYKSVCVVNPIISFGFLDIERQKESSLCLLDMCDELWTEHGILEEDYEIEYCKKYKIPIIVLGRLDIDEKTK